MTNDDPPEILFTRPASVKDDDVTNYLDSQNKPGKAYCSDPGQIIRGRHLPSIAKEVSSRPSTPGQDVYLGSYAPSIGRGSFEDRSPNILLTPSPRASMSHIQLNSLLCADEPMLETYGVEELRDGFFDASFLPPVDKSPLKTKTKNAVQDQRVMSKQRKSSVSHLFMQQKVEVKENIREVITSRTGVALLRSFLGFYICYIVCLVPIFRDWLGRYNYIMVISAILNHSGRPVGSQLDGACLTILGTAAGLGWGSLALYVSTSTATSRHGYGGVLAAFLVLFTAAIGWLRCAYLRSYQAVLSAGFAICYTCLANTSQSVGWRKTFDYGIPWVLGQAVCFIVAICIWPEAGSRALSDTLEASLKSIQAVFVLPQPDKPALRRELAWHFVNLSQAVRDFTLDMSISRYRPEDVILLRNCIQAVIRSALSIEPNTKLFEEIAADSGQGTQTTTINTSDPRSAAILRKHLKVPTTSMINNMIEAISEARKILLHLGGELPVKTSVVTLDRLQAAKGAFDEADSALIRRPDLPTSHAKQPESIAILLFVHSIRQMVDKVELLMHQVSRMQHNNRGWRIRAPSYPWHKAFMRTNAQVRHDRGGLTAGHFFRSKGQLERSMADLHGSNYVPPHRQDNPRHISSTDGKSKPVEEISHKDVSKSMMVGIRYQAWNFLHRLQGFESRFALKVTIVTTLLSIPAWLPASHDWWNAYESWWAVVMVWTMMHPRVGGNLQDLLARTFCAAIGAVWAGLGFAAGNGSPYVLGVFAAIYMIPMLHRFTLSSHPRSGIVGCISFTVVSLTSYTDRHQTGIVTIAWTRGAAFIVGVVAAITVNWVLWPFVARHELRKSLATTLVHSAILYRNVIGRYIYFNEGHPPGPEDVGRSEMLEGRFREGFVRINQLLELTSHEIRLRAPFDPKPYKALITTCEAFFEHLVKVRQSSLYFQLSSKPGASMSTAAALITVRRDAAAVILINLYALAVALRADQPVPKYLPSAAVARRKLLDRMEVVEAESAALDRAKEAEAAAKGADEAVGLGEKERRRWADVYEYAFSGALTGIVSEVQELQRITKEICGEVGWDKFE